MFELTGGGAGGVPEISSGSCGRRGGVNGPSSCCKRGGGVD